MQRSKLSSNDKIDIMRSVTSAKNPNLQREIEAQLHCMSLRDVDDILAEFGVYVRRNTQQVGGRKKEVSDDVLRELAKKGCTVEEIAEETKYSVKHVYVRLRAIKRREALA